MHSLFPLLLIFLFDQSLAIFPRFFNCINSCKRRFLPKKESAFIPFEYDEESEEYFRPKNSGNRNDKLNLNIRDPDSDIVIYLEGLPIVGFAVAVSHECSDDRDRATRASASCACQSILVTYCWIGAKAGYSVGSFGGPLLGTTGVVLGSIVGYYFDISL
jgi:hypothetical protein